MTQAKQLSKALAFKREAWMQLAILEGLGRDPSFDRDVAFDAYSNARENYERIIRDEWLLRAMERPVPTPAALRTEHVRAA